MKYYKIMQNNEFIGAVCSDDFVRYQQKHQCYIGTNEQYGEFVSYNGILYRSTWMKPIQNPNTIYEVASLIAITEEQYQILINAIESNSEIALEPAVEPEFPETFAATTLADENTLKYVRDAKIGQMRNACNQVIEEGFDLELRGEVHHFSLTIQDQLNLITLSTLAQTQSLIPYHADGEDCIFYTSEEINEIAETVAAYKIYHTTYYNSLKNYINSLETIEEINAITYGVEIPEEYQTDVLKALS